MDGELLREARRLAADVFEPQAEAADQGDVGGIVAENVRALARAGYFGISIAREFGGMEADEETRHEFTETIAGACGVTAFTQQQFHAPAGYFRQDGHPDTRRELLPKFASGELIGGVAFSHLRRPGPPMVTAAPRGDGGYVVNGSAPWVTGWDLIDGFILAALEDETERQIFMYVPRAGNETALTAGEPVKVASMNASGTVVVGIDNLQVPVEHVVSVRPPRALQQGDHCYITGHVYLPLGCARGSIGYLRGLAARRASALLSETADGFQQEVDDCRREALRWNASCVDMPEYTERALLARAWAVDLAARSAWAAVAATGGSAQLLTSPAQRRYREAMFYTTLAITSEVQGGILTFASQRGSGTPQ